MYGENIPFMTAMKMVVALTFVPVNDVIDIWELLLLSDYFIENERLLENFLSCFESTWIGVKKRKNIGSQPLFSIELWNCYNDVLNDLPRTKNGVEGWHSRFSGRVGKLHADIGHFIKSLKTKQNLTEVLIEQIKTGKDVSRPKKKRFYKYDERMLNVVCDYNKDNAFDYLKTTSTLVVS